MKQYVIDAFTDQVFAGNPAAVLVRDRWLSDDLMQKIAIENNLSETAFAVQEGNQYGLRWFTPGGEINLCGHATLATAYVLFNEYGYGGNEITFHTLSGELSVNRRGELYELDFPAYALKEVPVTEAMAVAVGVQPEKAYLGEDLLLILPDEEAVKRVKPDEKTLLALDGLMVHITAKGSETDVVSRSFGPKLGVLEDPVCGRGHCHIIPYWHETLDQAEIVAYQASQRGGTLYCQFVGDRVKMAGHAVKFNEAVLFVKE